MKIINGKKIAASLNEELKDKLEILKQEKNFTPTLVVLLVGDNPASNIYVKTGSTTWQEVSALSIKTSSSEWNT